MGLLSRVGSVVSQAFALALVGGIVEVMGLTTYLLWRDEAALDALVAGGITPSEIVPFLLASPDRTAVAGALAVLAVLMVYADGSGNSTHATDGFDGDGFAGGFGGDGGDGGGDGGGGGGGGE